MIRCDGQNACVGREPSETRDVCAARESRVLREACVFRAGGFWREFDARCAI